jgi:hypothetical protein
MHETVFWDGWNTHEDTPSAKSSLTGYFVTNTKAEWQNQYSHLDKKNNRNLFGE